jgi:hypothetical protein
VRIFGPKKGKVTGELRKLHNEVQAAKGKAVPLHAMEALGGEEV